MIRRRFYPRYDRHRQCVLVPIRVSPFFVDELKAGIPVSHLKLEPHEDDDGTFLLILRSPDDRPPEPIRPGQTVAYHGKLTDLAERRGLIAQGIERGLTKAQALGEAKAKLKHEAMTTASMMFGRTITSSQELTAVEANRLLDWLEDELEGVTAPTG